MDADNKTKKVELSDSKVTIYYDGQCHLCSREIDHYKTFPTADRVIWKDIADPRFDAQAEGRSLEEFNRAIHLKRTSGEFVVGVDAFLELWEALDRFGGLAKIMNSKLGRPVFDLGYAAFARLRVYLPKRKNPIGSDTCDSGRCEIG